MNRILIAAILFCACTYVSAEDLLGKRTEAHRQRVKTIGLKKIMALAEKGDAAAQHDFGLLYISGEFGVEKNQKQSFLWQKNLLNKVTH